MAQYPMVLDDVFHALADPTLRAVLSRLGSGPATVGELAEPFDMTLPSFMKHIHLLERSGWISTRKVGRVRACTIERSNLEVAGRWLQEQRAVWESRTDRLERFVTSKESEAQ